MPSWPGTLPSKPLEEAFKETAPNMVVRTQMDAGPAKIRRRFTAAPRPMTMQFSLTSTQVAALDTFYVTTLTGGADEFDWNDPRTNSSESFRFLAPPEYTPAGGDNWTATVSLELMP